MLENIAFFPTKREKINRLSTLKVWRGENLLRVPTLLSVIIELTHLKIGRESFNSPSLKLVIGKLFMPTVLACIHHEFIAPINLRELWSGSLFKRRHNIVAMT